MTRRQTRANFMTTRVNNRTAAIGVSEVLTKP